MNYIPQSTKKQFELIAQETWGEQPKPCEQSNIFPGRLYELEQLLVKAQLLLCLVLQFDACTFRCKKLHL